MKKLIILLFMVVASFTSAAQMEKYQALFMYKFVQNLEWPASKLEGGYKIGVLGSDNLFDELSKLVDKRTVNGKPISVVKYTPGSSMSDLCMIFLGNRSKDLIGSLSKSSASSSTIIVGETPGLARKGAGLNFVTQGGSLKFEMNESSLKTANVQATGAIKSLAILID